MDAEVVVDGNFVTARGKRDCHAFLREYMKLLGADAKSRRATARAELGLASGG